jgi:hypothetical protein
MKLDNLECLGFRKCVLRCRQFSKRPTYMKVKLLIIAFSSIFNSGCLFDSDSDKSLATMKRFGLTFHRQGALIKVNRLYLLMFPKLDTTQIS